MRDHRSVFFTTGTVVLVLVVSITLGHIGFAPQTARAQNGDLHGTITVVGEGTVNIKPDMAQANIGVEVVKPTVAEASSEASNVMDMVLGALKDQGVDDKDMQTSGFSVWSERNYEQDGSPGEVTYRVSNQVNVTIRDLDSLGAVLDAAMESGANNIYGVTFGLSDTSSVESQARKDAVDNARTKAEELAELTDLKLGRVISVSEVVGGIDGYYAGDVREAAVQGYGGGGPILPGELELTLQLQIVYVTVH